jgi:hypothetical protein
MIASSRHRGTRHRVIASRRHSAALWNDRRHYRKWRLVRRLQSEDGEGADWLVVDPQSGEEFLLEVSGTDEGPFERRVREKRAQASQAALAAGRGKPAVSVVRFLEPKAMLEG